MSPVPVVLGIVGIVSVFLLGLIFGRFASRKAWRTIAACLAVIVGGLVASGVLTSMKEPPPQTPPEEMILRVTAAVVQPEDVVVSITSFGEVRTLNTVDVAAEVAGRVVNRHPSLEVGGLIPAGEVLFEIDRRDYEARVAQAEANLAMQQDTLDRLRKQFEIDRSRLGTLNRSRDLAQSEFERQRELFQVDEVGTKSGVEQSERAYLSAKDMAEQLAQAVALYPTRISEAENAMETARASLDLARLSLDRTVVRAPFDARVKSRRVETGQYVAPGTPLLTLAEDSLLEISVPLDSREAANFLRFDARAAGDAASWFNHLEPVPCEIRWTEDKGNHVWQGNLNRVERFDEATRTVTVAVRVEGEGARSADPDRLPLVEGMFCEVTVEGRTVQGVYRLPSTAVNFEGTVCRVVEGRLKTTPVERAFIRGEEVFISAGLNPGDTVITTRLVDPLDNTLIEIVGALPTEAKASQDGSDGGEEKDPA